ncbi:MAG: hypothetical protein ACTSUO_05730 [Candidatus Thorarchaeota archaeon]
MPNLLRFIQLLPNISNKADFILKDLPGSGKRIDVLCRCLSACFDWGPTIWSKSELEFIAVIGKNSVLRIRNPQSQGMTEIWWATMLKNALRGEPPEFIKVSHESLDEIIREIQQVPQSKIWMLEESGQSLEKEIQMNLVPQNSFMLGDHRGFNSQTLKLVEEFDIDHVSIGKLSYLGSHTVATVISTFERVST